MPLFIRLFNRLQVFPAHFLALNFRSNQQFVELFVDLELNSARSCFCVCVCVCVCSLAAIQGPLANDGPHNLARQCKLFCIYFLISLSTNCNWQLSARKSSRMDDHLCQSAGQPAYWHAQPGFAPALLPFSLFFSPGAISGAFRGKHCWRLMPSNLFDVYKSWPHCLAASRGFLCSTHSRTHTHTLTHIHTRMHTLPCSPL